MFWEKINLGWTTAYFLCSVMCSVTDANAINVVKRKIQSYIVIACGGNISVKNKHLVTSKILLKTSPAQKSDVYRQFLTLLDVQAFLILTLLFKRLSFVFKRLCLCKTLLSWRKKFRGNYFEVLVPIFQTCMTSS